MTNQSATPGEVRSSEQLGATTRKRYPLEVEGGQTDDGAYCMSKGHHDKAVFLAEARLWWGDEVQGWTEPEHKWLRVVPDPNEEWRRGLLMDAKPHSRGAFPATWTESRSAITWELSRREAVGSNDGLGPVVNEGIGL